MSEQNRLCKLIGHDVTFCDGPYPVCNRCGAHAYYDSYDFYIEWHYWPLRSWYWLVSLPQSFMDWRARSRHDEDEIPF